MECHVVVRNDRIWIGQPLIKRAFIPDDVRGFQLIRVIEVGYTSGLSAVDIAQTRTFLALVERVAARASLLEELLAIVWRLPLPHLQRRLRALSRKIATASQMSTIGIKSLVSLPCFTGFILLFR